MLNTIPLFQNLNDIQLASIGAHMALRVVEKGEFVVRAGDKATSLYIIVAGSVKVVSADPDNPAHEVILKLLRPGEFFGEMPMFDKEAHGVSVVTLERCHFQELSYRAFEKAIIASPEIAQRVMVTMAGRLRAANRKIGNLALLDISSRVARTLLELAIMSNGRRVVGEQFTQKDLANMIGASREMVNRTLHDLQNDGFIEIHRRSITILKEDMRVN